MKHISIIAEIGINANGNLQNVFKLIDIAKFAGCDYVKFQKRNPDVCVPEEQKSILKQTPWGEMTYLEYKHRIEFNEKDYNDIDEYCKNIGIKWFASAWDKDSIDFLSKLNCEIIKIPSALATDIKLMKYARKNANQLLISTGMLNEKDVEYIAEHIKPDVLFHTNSTYPCPSEDLNLQYISWLQDNYKNDKLEIGYSGHENGLTTTFAAAALGITWIERHICLSHQDWGSDQACSLEPVGLIKLVKGIRDIELSLRGYGPREITKGELIKLKSLRK
jgi:N-acetylneuraminate synthase